MNVYMKRLTKEVFIEERKQSKVFGSNCIGQSQTFYTFEL